MTNESLVIILPLPAKNLHPNHPIASMKGRFAKASAAKRYRKLAREHIRQEEISSAPWPHIEVQVTFYHPTKRRRDTDNAIASIKSAYDGIVDSGLVSDDTPEYMTRCEPKIEFDSEFPRVEFVLTRMEYSE